MKPHLNADFQYFDPDVRMSLNTAGTLEDLARLHLSQFVGRCFVQERSL